MSALTIQDKAQQFHSLHHSGKMLVLPNIWDPLGALLLASLGYQAVATASASIAFTNGYLDGEKIPLEKFLSIIEDIVFSVEVPVSADIESGYANDEDQLQITIKKFLDTGIVGINIEDTNAATGQIYSIEAQCRRIRIIKDIAGRNNISLFVNARTDILLRNTGVNTDKDKFDEILKRGIAYKEAGADCFYPIALRQKEHIEQLIAVLGMPINIICIPGIPELKELNEMGVARLSLGPGFLKIAIKAMKKMASKLQYFEGLAEISSNDITTDYLKQLVTDQT